MKKYIFLFHFQNLFKSLFTCINYLGEIRQLGNASFSEVDRIEWIFFKVK